MQLRVTTDYAIRSVVYLATHGGICNAQEISDRMGITHNYTQQILRKLRASGIVSANVGNSGGYSLNKSPEEITVYDIMELFENRMKINASLEDDQRPGSTCSSVYMFYRHFQEMIEKTVRLTTVRDLMNSQYEFYLRREDD